MVEQELVRIKSGGVFSKRLEVLVETKFIRESSSGETKLIMMYDDKYNPVVKIQYTLSGLESKIDIFTVSDWSTNIYAEEMLKRFIRLMKKEGAKRISGLVYATDNKIGELLNVLRDNGFQINSGGSYTGYAQYNISRKL